MHRIPKKWKITITTSLCLFFLLGYYYYSEYTFQRDYHAQAVSIENHKWDDIKYENGSIRVHWVTLPALLNCDFEEIWLMNKIRQGWTEVRTFSHYKDTKPRYQMKGGSIGSDAPFWGQEVFVGNLNPGTYEIRVLYEYHNCPRANLFYIDRFEANQTIVFTIKFMIDEEGNSSLIGSPAS